MRLNPARSLLEWFDRAGRELPWRAGRDPYRIWVSEIMLQQTRVETVIPFYLRFLQRFPGVEELAAADEQEVLSLWSGLGYYGRARRMHLAARAIVGEGGVFPRSVEGLKALPGIGDYTAAAVASIAFGVLVPVLDGNVERVMARWIGFGGDPRKAAGKRKLLEAAASLLVRDRPGDGNQAMMELGATVCLPRSPECPICPLRAGCVAFAEGHPERYPARRARRSPVRVRRISALVRQGDRVLLVKRPADAEVLAGAWEVPWVDWAAAAEAEVGLGRRYGGSWKLGSSRGWVRHGITFRVLEVEVREASVGDSGAVAEAGEAQWFLPEECRRIHVSSLLFKILAA